MANIHHHIGIMGAHGTGKTTWANELKILGEHKLPHLRCAIVSEVARRCPFSVNQKTTQQSQEWIFHAHIAAELHHKAWADVVICDRTVLDSLAYAEVAGFKELVDACMPAALRHIDRYYDRLYFCRPHKGWLVNDGFRDTDPKFQEKVDACLADWVQTYKLAVTVRRGRNGNTV